MTMGEPRWSFRLIRWTEQDQARLDEYERENAAGRRRMTPLFFNDVHDCPTVYEAEDEARQQARAALSLWPRATHAVIELYEINELTGQADKLEDLYQCGHAELGPDR